MQNITLNDVKRIVSSTLDLGFSLHFFKTTQILRKDRIKILFDKKVTGYPLTKRQKLSILLDEKRNLVLAGAGTGKTTTIIGKILYLIQEKKCKEEEILAIAFSKAAKEEIEERLKSHGVEKVKIKTFHALGLEIYKKTYGDKREVTKLSNKALSDFVNNIIRKNINEDLNKKLAKYFSEYLVPFSPDVGKTEDEYLRWKNTTQLITLNKDYVKSYGEILIGNFLYINNIQHSYEERYPGENYHPDFHISNSKTYIEYYGIDKNGNTAPWISRKKYKEGIEWKKKLHEKNGTNLIEITFADVQNLSWKSKLVKELNKFEHNLRPISDKEIINRGLEVNGNKETKFSKLICDFLSLYKSKYKDIIELDRLLEDYEDKNNFPDKNRIITFLHVFKNIFIAYENRLKSSGEIDFSDMLNEATKLINNNKYFSKWKYIIVDEFQDTSFSQSELISSCLNQNENTKLYAVGDDWQSIFSFSGADYHMMTDFKKHFGADKRFLKSRATYINLDETFRFDSSISDNTKKFILKNKTQIPKKLNPAFSKISNKISMFIYWVPTNIEEAIDLWLTENKSKEKYIGKNLLILSRYNYQFKNLSKTFIDGVKEKWSINGKVNYKTCHKAKGLEEDVILILGLSSDSLGFPSNIEDDPILQLVLTDPDEYQFAEERRVLYVAMTRAKFETHLLCDYFSQSAFSTELAKRKEFNIKQINLISDFKTLLCPKCSSKGGVIRNKTKKPGKKNFYKCNREPICDYVGTNCPKCDSLMVKDHEVNSTNAVCSNKTCDNQDPFCDKCGIGIMNRKPPFDENKIGCSQFPVCRNIK